MDTDFIFSVLFIFIFVIISIEWDEGFLLFLLGFLAAGIAINIDTVFSLSSSDFQGMGGLLQAIYGMIAVFAFAKTYFTAKGSGFDPTFGKLRKHGR